MIRYAAVLILPVILAASCTRDRGITDQPPCPLVIIMTPQNVQLAVGDTVRFTVSFDPYHCLEVPPAAAWSLNSDSVAQIVATTDSTALTRGIAPGLATITATSQALGKPEVAAALEVVPASAP